jgi:hypothetical protein
VTAAERSLAANQPLDVLRELGAGRVSVLGLLRQSARNDTVESPRNPGDDLGWGFGVLVEDLPGDGREVRAEERRPAQKGRVEEGAEREQVAPAVDLVGLELLGQHVVRGADHGAGLGQVRIGELRDSKIGDLRNAFRGEYSLYQDETRSVW